MILNVVALRLQIVSDSFICRGPEYWNTLPDYIKECETKKPFKTKMKKMVYIQLLKYH